MDTQIKRGTPHYLLFVDTSVDNRQGQWKFTLKEAEGRGSVEVSDAEPGVSGERLDLLTTIRALESLDQPSRVTLTSSTKYLRHGIWYGITEWRANDWQWEFFGNMVPVKNADLWRRMDNLMRVHSIECRQCRIDAPHDNLLTGHKTKQQSQPCEQWVRDAAQTVISRAVRVASNSVRQRLALAMQSLRRRLLNWHVASKTCPGNG